MKTHEYFMARCLEIAKSGLPWAMPNPSVGAVIVHNDLIIAEGYTSAYGGPHGEVNAFKQVKNPNLLPESTLYVSLEPCSHFGKTPPCCDLVIAKGIKKVVVGMIDPFSEVAGKGIEKMRQAGIEVIVGVLEKECWESNKRFFTFHQKKRPYVILKWAQTQNGFIAPLTKTENKPVWITNTYTRQWVHKLRSEEQAILVGTNTVLADNPKLDTRDYYGRSATRVIIDRDLNLSPDLNIYDQSQKTIIINEIKQEVFGDVYFEKINFEANRVIQILNILYLHKIQSVIIEGGTKTLQSFIESNLWDEAYICIGNQIFNDGIKAPIIKNNTLIKQQQFVLDKIYNYKNNSF